MQERFTPPGAPAFRGICEKCGNIVCKLFPPPGFSETEDADLPDRMLCAYCSQRGLVEVVCVYGQCSAPDNLTSVFEVYGSLRGYDMRQKFLLLEGIDEVFHFGERALRKMLRSDLTPGCDMLLVCWIEELSGLATLLDFKMLADD